MKGRATVIGGSIGGLFAAALLQRKGWNVNVHERGDVELSGRGAGIVTHPQLLDALRAAGADTRDVGVLVEKRIAYDRAGIVTHAFDFPQLVTSWDRLQSLIRATIPKGRCHLGHWLDRFNVSADGVRAFFKNGYTADAELIVGADGFRSSVRGQVFPEVQPEYAGYIVWRGAVADADLDRSALASHTVSIDRRQLRAPPHRRAPEAGAAGTALEQANDLRDIRHGLKRYRRPQTTRSLFEVAVSVLPFLALWLAMWFALLHVGYWLTLLLAFPAAGFLVRIFLVQHDCGHGSVFHRQWVNDWLGRVLGVVTLTPYDHWRRTHALHHAGSGNLDRRGIGDVATLTVREFRSLGWWGRFRYRVYRHPMVLFGVGPFFVFIFNHRLPIGFMRGGTMHWTSTMGTNAAIVAATVAAMWMVGVVPFLTIHAPIAFLASAAGVWLFYVQHQFEHTRWDATADWAHAEAALHGSSHYQLPAVLSWFTANIGIHHVHHLSSCIPHYRLPEVLRDYPELREVNRLTLWESVKCVRLTLWDEDLRRLVPFSAA